MATIGKTTTPTTGTHGFIAQTGWLVVMNFTSPGGWFSSVTFWAAGNGATRTLHGGIWQGGTGNNLAFGPGVATSGGAASGVGANAWWTDTFSSEVFIASGTNIWIGWQPDTNNSIAWAYNGTDHSPDAWRLATSGSSAANIASIVSESPAGAVAAYATYTQYAPATPTFSPGFGPPGTSVTISGNHFLPATGVTFNGVSASFSVVNDTTITATVPAGAGAGPIAVTTPYGTGTSASNFLAGVLERYKTGSWQAFELDARRTGAWSYLLPQRRNGSNWNVGG